MSGYLPGYAPRAVENEFYYSGKSAVVTCLASAGPGVENIRGTANQHDRIYQVQGSSYRRYCDICEDADVDKEDRVDQSLGKRR